MTNKDLTVLTPHGKLNIRVGGLCFQNGKILLQQASEKDFWFIIGGRIQFGETSEQALIRELQEELRVTGAELEFAAVTENFFHENGHDYHEISPHYRVTLPDNFIPPTHEENGDPITLAWHRIEDLVHLDIRPVFIKENVKNLQTGVHHFITS